MFGENHKIMIEAIFSLRKSLEVHLPIKNSLIAYDIILLLSIHNYAQGNITIKQLFYSLPHSDTAIRYHYNRFKKDGWIETYVATQDKRIKFVRPTYKLIQTVNSYIKEAENFLIKDLGKLNSV